MLRAACCLLAARAWLSIFLVWQALNTTLTNAAEDTKAHIQQLMPVILQRLEATFQMQIVSNDDREAQSELQGLLCGCIQVMTQKLGEQTAPHFDRMMQVFLQVRPPRSNSLARNFYDTEW